MNDRHGGLGALSLLARGLAGVDVEVQALAGRGTRAVLTGRKLLLPDGTGEAALRRAMVAHGKSVV